MPSNNASNDSCEATMICLPGSRSPVVTVSPRFAPWSGSTPDLRFSGELVVVNGNVGPDYFRSRMMAFESVIASGRRRPWNSLYAEQVRGLCRMLSVEGRTFVGYRPGNFGLGPFRRRGSFLLCGNVGEKGNSNVGRNRCFPQEAPGGSSNETEPKGRPSRLFPFTGKRRAGQGPLVLQIGLSIATAC